MPSPLVSADWLEAHLEDEDLRVIELRGKVLPPSEPPPHYLSDRAGYQAAHIPGAVYVDWQVDIVEPGSPSNDIIAPADFAALMEGLGVSNSTTIVLSDDAANMFACRLRWALRYYGHERLAVLDGGWANWRAEGRPVSGELPAYPRGNFAVSVNAALIASKPDILRDLGSGAMQLVDVRSPAEYQGISSRAKQGGHIPSALNLPRSALLADDMTLRPAAELRAIFQRHGIALDAPDTVLYCNSGVSATYGMLAMEVAGAANLRVYDGSWKDWGNDETTPKAT